MSLQSLGVGEQKGGLPGSGSALSSESRRRRQSLDADVNIIEPCVPKVVHTHDIEHETREAVSNGIERLGQYYLMKR
jgi:hypothetical protein